MTKGKDDKRQSVTGLARARLWAEASGIAPSDPLLAAVAERLDLLLSELDSVGDEALEGIEPATTFSAGDGTDDV